MKPILAMVVVGLVGFGLWLHNRPRIIAFHPGTFETIALRSYNSGVLYIGGTTPMPITQEGSTTVCEIRPRGQLVIRPGSQRYVAECAWLMAQIITRMMEQGAK